MPKDNSIKKVLVIGSGPIVIGQAAEFDYAGSQACRALKSEGVEVVLVNSNPATIMTDKAMADKIYIEPLTLETLKRIIRLERPDSILSGLGGQTGLTLSMQLARSGILQEYHVKLLGSSVEAIDNAEDRQLFKDKMLDIGQPLVPSKVVNTVEDAEAFTNTIGYPIIVRPAFTLGGSGGGIAKNRAELHEIVTVGLETSPITQVLIEKCISGWKEVEFEVMRDRHGNAITICSMENVDPVGVHTGDSIVVAPAITLSDKEYSMLRSAALSIVCALGIEGGCNCQFALHPDSMDYAVIEVNPRVSRSSALASKATGYPIAKVATLVALGYSLNEIVNSVTGTTYASFEPSIDYIAVKMPKWPFDKFGYANKRLGTQMKATGEVLSIAPSFEAAIMKAVRGCELGMDTLSSPKYEAYTKEQIDRELVEPTDVRLFAVYEALRRGMSIDYLYAKSKIDEWFLYKLKNLVDFESDRSAFTYERYCRGKILGYPDAALKRIFGEFDYRLDPVYRMVDTCGGEYEAKTPYFYGMFRPNGINEAVRQEKSDKKKIIVLGSGPIRIGQGIEFDYCSVHATMALRKLGYEVIIINNNPETVSTDFDISDRLYFEPLCYEDVMHIYNLEKPEGIVVAFGGGTAIKLADKLTKAGVKIIGSNFDSIDMAEDRERFDALLGSLGILRPEGVGVHTEEEAKSVANRLGYPVLVRPSYVLGGQNMTIAYCDEDIEEFVEIIKQMSDSPILIDKYISGLEAEVDAVFDGEDLLIPGIMEHVERTGVHSGDSMAVYPPSNIDDVIERAIYDTTYKLCKGLNVCGIVNIQYIVKDGLIYVIEVNPRSSRTVPIISKVTDVPVVDIAMKVSLGYTLKEQGYSSKVMPNIPYVAVKVPVFSFEKLSNVDTHLGPEMKSTGEVLALGKSKEEALYKAMVAAGYKFKKKGGLFVSVKDSDKAEIVEIVKKFTALGFDIYATAGTKVVLDQSKIKSTQVDKIHEGGKTAVHLMEKGKISYIISTSKKGRDPSRDSVQIRRKAVTLGIPCLTSLDTANALAMCLMSKFNGSNFELVDICSMRHNPQIIPFTKMQTAGNDYIYINCFETKISNPESLAVLLSDRHYGVGGDGLVLISPSKTAAARMQIYNTDGSEGRVGGNPLRCVAKFLYDNGYVKANIFDIDTMSGLKTVRVKTTQGKVTSCTVEMGRAEFASSLIPSTLQQPETVDYPVSFGGKDYRVTLVNLGNPHCVMFADNTEALDVNKIGKAIESDKMFPERVNVEFVQVVDHNTLKMRVYERGTGETLACGSGACAAVAAAVKNGFVEANQEINVILLGGVLSVKYTDEMVWLTGDCKVVFRGEVEL